MAAFWGSLPFYSPLGYLQGPPSGPSEPKMLQTSPQSQQSTNTVECWPINIDMLTYAPECIFFSKTFSKCSSCALERRFSWRAPKEAAVGYHRRPLAATLARSEARDSSGYFLIMWSLPKGPSQVDRSQRLFPPDSRWWLTSSANLCSDCTVWVQWVQPCQQLWSSQRSTQTIPKSYSENHLRFKSCFNV